MPTSVAAAARAEAAAASLRAVVAAEGGIVEFSFFSLSFS